MIKRIRFIAIIYLSAFSGSAQIQWHPSLEPAINIAQLQDKLILIDFTATWCGPCRKMDKYVWSDKEVDSLARKFVTVKIDIDKSPQIASAFKVTSIPRILIMDARSKVMDDLTGYHPANLLEMILQSYPADVRIINEAIAKLHKNSDEDFFGNYQVGLAYQRYLPLLVHPARQFFYNESILYLKTAEKIAGKAEQPAMEQKAIIAQSLTHALAGREKKAIKGIEAKYGLENLDPSNQGYAHYVLALSYYKTGDENAYKEHLTRLENLSGAKYLLKMLNQQVADL